LESLRESALRDARSELGAAQKELNARTLAWQAAHAARLAAEAKLDTLQGKFAEASELTNLRLLEQGIRAATLDVVGASARAKRAEVARAVAERRVREAELRVSEHTAGQKAVGQALEQRVASEQRRVSQREEDEVDDLIRVQRA
jgi:hypothetical protein